MLQALINNNNGFVRAKVRLMANGFRSLAGVFLLAFALVLTGCSEEHPDNKPGAENNPFPTVALAAVSEVTQPAANSTTRVTVQINLSRPAPAAGSVRLRTVNGSAQAGTHFTEFDSSVTFAAGERLATAEIVILDGAGEPSTVQFSVAVVSGSNVDLAGSSALSQPITIVPAVVENPDNGETPPAATPNLQLPNELTFNAPRPGRAQVDYPVVFTLDTPAASAGSVTLQSVEGTAEAGTNFVALNEVVSVAEGARELAFTLSVLGDANQTSNLEFSLLAMSAENIALPEQRSVAVTIVNANNEFAAPTLALPSLTELPAPNSGSREYQLLMALSVPAPQAGSVQVRSQELSAQAGVHFTGFANEITFAAGATEIFLPVTVNHVANLDTAVDFVVQLSAPVNLQLPSAQEFTLSIQPAVGSVVVPELQLPAVISVPEPRASVAAVDYEFWLPLSQPASADGAVLVRTFAGSALAGVNYTAINNQRIEFNAGDDIVRVPLEVLHEGGLDAAKELQLQFSGAENLVLPASRSLTIAIGGADGELPLVSIDNELEVVRPPEGEETTITVVLPLTPAAILPGELRLAVNQGSALIGRDITAIASAVSFARGDYEVVLTFNLIGSFATADRTFSLVLTEASNAILPSSFVERQINVTIVTPE